MYIYIYIYYKQQRQSADAFSIAAMQYKMAYESHCFISRKTLPTT